MKILTLTTPAGYTVREVTLNGHEYLVVPVVALVEGVHRGANNIPTYYSATEITQSASAWNNIPLTIQHPRLNGDLVSIHDGDADQQFTIGLFRNVNASGGRLRGEAWIDVGLAGNLAPQVLGMVQGSQPIEVSTGLFASATPVPGAWRGEQYQEAVHDFRPDHLALLPGGRGACSIADGCGVRANQKIRTADAGKGHDMKTNLKALFARWRATFVAALKANEVSLDDINHELNMFVNALDSPEYINSLKEVYEGYFIYETCRRDAMTGASVTSRLYKRSYVIDANTNKVEIADDAVEVREETKFIPIEPAANTDPSQSASAATQTSNNDKLKETKPMKELIDALISCNCTPYTEEDRVWMNTLAEPQLTKLKADQYKLADNKESEKKDPPVPDTEKKPEANAAPVTFEEVLKSASDEVRNLINEGVAQGKALKSDVISKLIANKANTFTKEQLEAKPIAELRQLAALANVEVTVDYTAAAPPRANSDAPKPMPSPWARVS